ncbi:MAG: glycosyltransferase family 61 protein [Oscillatoriales cyanobacterium C42_A2020_001]|nr:glycosyltransferase family 61 protein [Leptolyngbyaceae cyanobacterium C42_A2020_001]
MLNLAPLQQRILRLIQGRKTYQDVCDRQWILCPGERATHPPAIYLPAALEKVTAVPDTTTYANELTRIQGGTVEHGATTAYQLRDVHFLSGYVYKGAMKHVLVTTKEAFLKQGTTELIAEAALACTWVGNRFFGHWITDDLTLTLAAQQLATAVTVSKPLTQHQIGYSTLFDIQTKPISQAFCKRFIIIDDVGQNSFKRQRYQTLRTKLQQEASSPTHPGVMFLRKDTGVQRSLLNEPKIAQFLQAQGFTILDAETLSAVEIVQKTLGARIVVGVEGSQLVHGLFPMSENGVMLTLQPPYRFNNVYKDYTDCLGLRYAFVIGNPVADGFEIDIDDLARTLDAIALV